MPITIAEAIEGGTIEVPTLNGTKRIRIPAGTKHGTVQRLRGEGPPKPGAGAAETSSIGSRSRCPTSSPATRSRRSASSRPR